MANITRIADTQRRMMKREHLDRPAQLRLGVEGVACAVAEDVERRRRSTTMQMPGAMATHGRV